MARVYLTPIDLAKNELQNAVVQSLPSAPGTPVKGQIYYNSGDNTLYWYNNTSWIPAKTGAPSGNAGGALSGTYPNPTLAADAVDNVNIRNLAITPSKVDAAYVDGLAANASLRTIGTGAQQAAAGNHTHAAASNVTDGDKGEITVSGGVWTIDNGVITTAKIADDTITIADLDETSIRLNTIQYPSGVVSMNLQRLASLGDPVVGTDAAHKDYVDSVAQGLDPKGSVKVATTANITLSGTQTIDGIAVVAGDRVLVKDQSTPAQNGIYIVAAGAWTRATDMDTWSEVPGSFTFVEQSGGIQAESGWVCTADTGGTLGTTAITFVQFSGAGQITAGTGMTKSGNQLNVIGGTGITANADDIAVNFAGNGAANTSARSDHNHDTSYAPLARTISTTAPLTGGGDLSANRTLAISNFSSGAAGAVPASGGGTANFLRADGTWTTPGGGGTVNKYAVDVGGATSQVITHNLGTRDVTVEVYRNSTPWDSVECDVERTTTTTCTIRFAVAPASAAYRAVVTG